MVRTDGVFIERMQPVMQPVSAVLVRQGYDYLSARRIAGTGLIKVTIGNEGCQEKTTFDLSMSDVVKLARGLDELVEPTSGR